MVPRLNTAARLFTASFKWLPRILRNVQVYKQVLQLATEDAENEVEAALMWFLTLFVLLSESRWPR